MPFEFCQAVNGKGSSRVVKGREPGEAAKGKVGEEDAQVRGGERRVTREAQIFSGCRQGLLNFPLLDFLSQVRLFSLGRVGPVLPNT